jgi:nitrogen fixation protein FixH
VKILLIIVCIIGLAAVIGAIIVGKNTFEGTVVDKPYEQGLSYDALRKEREESGWSVDIMQPVLSVGRNDLIISVIDRQGKPLSDSNVSVTVSRPSSSAYDKTYQTVGADRGQHKAEIDLPLYGHWDLKIQVMAEGKSVTFEKRIFAEKGKP